MFFVWWERHDLPGYGVDASHDFGFEVFPDREAARAKFDLLRGSRGLGFGSGESFRRAVVSVCKRIRGCGVIQ